MKQRLIGNLIYGQSGGPTSVINSSAYGLFKEALKNKDVINKVYYMKYGIEGLLNELIYTPGAAFGSNRYKLKTSNSDVFLKILNIFKKYNIRYFFYNGGNDSMDTIAKLTRFFKENKYDCKCIGIPKTIDNDLVYTDHTPGYASAAKFIINSIIEIYYDDLSYLNGKVNIIEIMGRNAGWLTASSIVASERIDGPDLIFVPETDFDIDVFLNKVKEIYEKKKRCLVCVSEGIHLKNNKPIFDVSNRGVDAFNHVQLGGVCHYLSDLVTKKLGYKSRGIELSILQRANSMIPSEIDIKEAIKVGKYALKSAIRGKTGCMVAIKRLNDYPYKVTYNLVNLDLIRNKVKYLPLIYVDTLNHNIDKSFINYVVPLINSEEKKHLKKGYIDTYNLK